MIRRITLFVLTATTGVALLNLQSLHGAGPAGKNYIDTHVHVMGGVPPAFMQKEQASGRTGFDDMHRFNRERGPGGGKENLTKAAENLISRMDRFGVEKALIVVVPGKRSPEKEYAEKRWIVSRYPHRFKLMAGGATLGSMLQDIDPDRVSSRDKKQFKETAEKLIREGAAGFGEMIAYHLCMAKHHSFQMAIPDHPLFLLLSDIAAEHDVPVDIHMEAVETERPMPANLKRACAKNPDLLTPTIPAFEGLLAHNRRARIVWQHIGWDNAGGMNTGLLSRLLKDHPNLFMALRVEERPFQVGSSRVPMPNRIVDTYGKLRPEWLSLIQSFPDRFMIGSDEFFFPTNLNRIARSFNQTWPVIDQLPNDLIPRVGRTNAAKVYRIK